MARLADPIHAGFENHLYEGDKISYPDPANRYSLGSRILLESPDVAKVSCDHPKIVSAVEELLGGRAVLSQYQSYLSPPGYVNSGSTTHTAGHGTHCTPRRWLRRWLSASDLSAQTTTSRSGPWGASSTSSSPWCRSRTTPPRPAPSSSPPVNRPRLVQDPQLR